MTFRQIATGTRATSAARPHVRTSAGALVSAAVLSGTACATATNRFPGPFVGPPPLPLPSALPVISWATAGATGLSPALRRPSLDRVVPTHGQGRFVAMHEARALRQPQCNRRTSSSPPHGRGDVRWFALFRSVLLDAGGRCPCEGTVRGLAGQGWPGACSFPPHQGRP